MLRVFAKVGWGLEQQKTFDDLKQYLQHLPTLSSPEQEQPLILYVSATHSVVTGGLSWIQKVLLRGGEDLICSCYERKEVVTLFRGMYQKSANKSAVALHFWQQGQL
jgi:hypothetical protein